MFERGERGSHEGVWEDSPGRRHSKYKGPETDSCTARRPVWLEQGAEQEMSHIKSGCVGSL